MGWWIIGTDHLYKPFVGWDRGDEHPAFGYQGVVAHYEVDGGQ